MIRLTELVETDAIQREVLFDLLLTNRLPLSIDDEGYLCLEMDKKSLETLIREALTTTTDGITSRQGVITARMDRIIREELGGLIDEALERAGAIGQETSS